MRKRQTFISPSPVRRRRKKDLINFKPDLILLCSFDQQMHYT